MIGITGPYQEAVKYGQIYTAYHGNSVGEMLVKEQKLLVKEQKLLDETIRNRYAEEWMKRRIP